MARGRSQFVGSAGEFYVAYGLAVRNIHAALTLGNAPDVDIIVSSGDGARHLALQVKTSRWAHRPKRYGYELCEWDVSAGIINRGRESLLFAFVDLREDNGSWKPIVYIVPSLWVAAFVQPEWGRKMYMLRANLWSQCQERWDRVELFLAGDAETFTWCSTIPPEAGNWEYPIRD